MAFTINIPLRLFSGVTGLVTKLYPRGSSSIANGAGDTLTESGSSGLFSATVAESLAGWHDCIVELSGGGTVAEFEVKLGDSTVTVGETAQLADAIDEISAAAGGIGAYQITLSGNDGVMDGSGSPLPGARVWLTTSTSVSKPSLAEAVSDAAGSVRFYLDAGTYYVRTALIGYKFAARYKTLVVTGDEQFTLT